MILTLVAMIGVGRWYYQLAHEYDKNRGGFAVLGGGLTIVLQFLFGFIAGFIAVATGNLEWLKNTLIISLLALAFSAIVIVIVYKMLERKWENDRQNKDDQSNLLDR